jgi:hypothetical protein
LQELSGCFVTTDDGANWSLTVNGMKGSYITDLVNTGSVIMACTNGGGIYTSANSGADWSAANNGFTESNQQSLFVNGSRIFVELIIPVCLFPTTMTWTPSGNELRIECIFFCNTWQCFVCRNFRQWSFHRPIMDLIDCK